MMFHVMSDANKKQLTKYANQKQRFITRGVQTEESALRTAVSLRKFSVLETFICKKDKSTLPSWVVSTYKELQPFFFLNFLTDFLYS